MRVAMVILEYSPLTGGAQRQIAAVAPMLAQRGIEVHVLTRQLQLAALAEREEIDGVPVHRLAAPGPKAIASLCFTTNAIARLAALRPDIVHAHSLFSPATIAALARERFGVGAVVKVLRGGRGGDVERLRAKLASGVRVRALRHSIDGFVAISDEIDAELDGLGIAPGRRHRIPNGVDTARFRPAAPADRAMQRRRLALPAGPTAIYCGRLVREKQVALLLEAWKRLSQRRPEGALVIVGDGPEGASLRRMAPPGVHFTGAREDVLPYLQCADAFVLPSDAEGLSNAMLEAMAVQLPIVATRVGAATELVSDPDMGRLVRPRDPIALSDALEVVLFDPARADLGQRARERVVNAFDLGSIADRLASLYEEVSNGRVAAGGFPRPAHARRDLGRFAS